MGNWLRTLRGKIIGVTLLVVLGTQAATVSAVLFAFGRDSDLRAEANVRDGADIFARLIENRAQLLEKVAEPLAGDEQFLAALAARRGDKVVEELTNRTSWIDADVAIVIDNEGRVRYASGALISPSAVMPELTRTGNMATSVDGDYFDAVSFPLGDGSGWLALGYALDDVLAQRLAAVTGLEMTLIVNEGSGRIRVLGSSLPRDGRHLLTGVSNAVASGAAPLEAAERLKTDYVSERIELFTEGIDLFAIIQEPMTEAMAPFAALRGSLLHAAATGLICALLMAFYLSRMITQPIRGLLLAARRMRVGNYSRELGIESKDEFGELATAFESMRAGIAEREKHIVFQSQHDSLTGLPNRNHAIEMLRAALRISSKTGNSVVVMVMHLRRFREIQSSLGHEIGDEVLRQTAGRIAELLQEKHTLARLEGDQFLIIAPGSDRSAGKEIAGRLADTLSTGFAVKSVNVALDVCIGMCVAPEHGQQPDELLRRAAVAKNDAQESQTRVRVYQNGREARHVRQLAILGDLRRAARDNELEMYLQPKVTLKDTKVCGAEALLRWNHPELGPVPPQEFIPLAESAGSISIITEWVIERAIQQCAAWKVVGIDLPIAINLSSRDLLNRELPEFVGRKLAQYEVSPFSIAFEITEAAVVRDLDRTIDVLDRLQAMGMSIALDDFGTGYSSLSHLQKLPVDELKIDRSFVKGLPDYRQNAAIVRSIIELAHNLALEVVAEGVETTAALRWLRAEGCERAQGYYLSKPLPAAELQEWLRSWEVLANEEREHNPDESLILRPRLIN